MLKRFYFIVIIFLILTSCIFSLFNPSISRLLKFPIKTKYILTSTYGYRKLGTYHFHAGIDLATTIGTPVYALSDGVVKYVGFYSSFGNCIIISYYNGYKSIYGHLDSTFKVNVGDSVNVSTIVGYIGPKYLPNGELNGMTTGPHLHFALYKKEKLINPLSISFYK